MEAQAQIDTKTVSEFQQLPRKPRIKKRLFKKADLACYKVPKGWIELNLFECKGAKKRCAVRSSKVLAVQEEFQGKQPYSVVVFSAEDEISVKETYEQVLEALRKDEQS